MTNDEGPFREDYICVYTCDVICAPANNRWGALLGYVIRRGVFTWCAALFVIFLSARVFKPGPGF